MLFWPERRHHLRAEPSQMKLTNKKKSKSRTFLTQFFHIVIKIFAGDEFPGSHKSVTHCTGFVKRWSCRERQWPQQLLVAVTEMVCPAQIQWSPFKEGRCLWQPGWANAGGSARPRQCAPCPRQPCQYRGAG